MCMSWVLWKVSGATGLDLIALVRRRSKRYRQLVLEGIRFTGGSKETGLRQRQGSFYSLREFQFEEGSWKEHKVSLQQRINLFYQWPLWCLVHNRCSRKGLWTELLSSFVWCLKATFVFTPACLLKKFTIPFLPCILIFPFLFPSDSLHFGQHIVSDFHSINWN